MADIVKCQVLNTFLAATGTKELVAFLRDEAVNRYRGKYICNASVSDVMTAEGDRDFSDYLNSALVAFPVSGQLIAEMHVQGYPVAKKINMDAFVGTLLDDLAKTGNSILFVCRDKSDYEELVENLLDKHPGLNYELRTYDNINPALVKEDYVFASVTDDESRNWIVKNAPLMNALTIGLSYGLKTGRSSLSSDALKRIRPGYIGMNIRFMIATGGKVALSTLSWAPALAVLVTIFILSSQTGEISNQNSFKVATDVSRFTFLGIDMSSAHYEILMQSLNAIVRTLGHMGEYAALALCVGMAITVNGFHGRIRAIYIMFMCGVVSVADEIFQLFVPERYCDLFDVIVDCTSVMFVALIFNLIEKIFSIIIRKKKEPVSYRGHRRKFLNIFIDDISFDEAVDRIESFCREETGAKRYVVTPNADHVVKLEKDGTFRLVYENADLIITDGTPLMWIAESVRCPITEKIPGADMLPRVCEMASKKGYTMFLLGAAEGVAKTAAEKLTKKYSGLNIVGTYSPSYGFENDEEELEKVFGEINKVCPDILVVGLGAPKQEKFIYKYRDRMTFRVALPFGAAIDFEAGNVKRAPKWMRKNGLEWFYRFLKEPGRLFKRYFIDDIKIFAIAWKYRYEIIRVAGKNKN